MKTLFCFLCIATAFPQSNPDGYIGGVSVHLTPMLEWGDADYNAEHLEIGRFDYQPRAGFTVRLVAPLSEKTSISVNYGFRSLDFDFKPDDSKLYLDEQVRGKLHYVSATLSLHFK